MSTPAPSSRQYLKSHPWLTFTLNLRPAPVSLWVLLGECQSKCEHIAGVPLRPNIAQLLQLLYLASGRGYFFPRYGRVAEVRGKSIAIDTPDNFVIYLPDLVEMAINDQKQKEAGRSQNVRPTVS